MKNTALIALAGMLLAVTLLGATVYGQGPDPSQSHLPPMREPANSKLPTLFIIGDSTVRNGQGDGKNGQWGWGDLIGVYFDPSKINVVNWALGGRSSRTFITEGHWDKVLAELKPGDFVMMQFGHNDGGPVNDTSRARGSIKGTGDETQEIDNMLTKKHEVVHTFGWYMRKYVTDTKAKGATPIVCSMIPRKIWKDGKIVRNSSDYAGWAAEVARSEHVPFVDLNEIIAARYDELGPEKVDPLFGDEHTHTTRAGAELNAECVIAGLKSLPNDPLAPYFSKKSRSCERNTMIIADLAEITGRTYPARRRTQNLVGGASPIQATNFSLGHVTLEPNGGQVPWHNQEQEEIYFIVEGTGEMCLGEEKTTVSRGPGGLYSAASVSSVDEHRLCADAHDLLLRPGRGRCALAAGIGRHFAARGQWRRRRCPRAHILNAQKNRRTRHERAKIHAVGIIMNGVTGTHGAEPAPAAVDSRDHAAGRRKD